MNARRIAVTAALAAILGLAGLQQASARGWGGGMGGGFPCQGYGPGYQMMDEATRAKVDAFRSETGELRRQLAMKRAEKQALLSSQTPDPAAVAKVEGELFDLRSEMQVKAREAGMPMMGPRGGMGGGYGMRGGPGWGGRGQGWRQGPCFNPQAWN